MLHSNYQSSEEAEVPIITNRIGSPISSPCVMVNPFCKLYDVNGPSKTLSLCNNLGKPIILMTNFILGGFLTSLITCVSKHG